MNKNELSCTEHLNFELLHITAIMSQYGGIAD